MQNVSLRVNEHYGDEDIELTFPDGWNIKRVEMACRDKPPIVDEDIRAKMDNTVGSPNIVEQARGRLAE